MIDTTYKVRRYIAAHSDKTEELLVEYELSSFDLKQFQVEFRETNSDDPMFDCYQIRETNLAFLKKYMTKEPEWDFVNRSYFVEVHVI